jgi:hypothetical protein
MFACASKTVSGGKHTFAVDTEIQSGELPSDQIDGVLGRTVLNHFELLYNGLTGKVIMRFIGKDTAERIPLGS